MKNGFPLLLVLLCLFSAEFILAQSFEGIIVIESSEPEGINATFTLKEPLAKVETINKNGALTLIKDQTTGQQILLRNRNGKKIAIIQNWEKDLRMIKVQAKEQAKQSVVAATLEVKLIDEHQEIDGYPCQKALIQNEQQEAVAWITKDLSVDLAQLFPRVENKKRSSRAIELAFRQHGFIMEFQIKNIETGKLNTIKTKVLTQEVDPTSFDIPNDYQVSDFTKAKQLTQHAKDNAKNMKKMQDAAKMKRKQ